MTSENGRENMWGCGKAGTGWLPLFSLEGERMKGMQQEEEGRGDSVPVGAKCGFKR